MKLSIVFAVFVSLYITISHSNPNLRKGELIESIIIKQTQGNYAEAINLFAAIGKLAKNHTVDLSDKEQKLFFDCYHYRRIQLRKDLVITNEKNNLKVLNNGAVKTKSNFYNLIQEIVEDLSSGSSYYLNANSGKESHYDLFMVKFDADKQYFEAWYTKGSDSAFQLSAEMYEEALEKVRTFLGDAEPTVLDACLGFSTSKLEYYTMKSLADRMPSPLPCDNAQNGLARGRNASSENNPDLIPLRQFINTYCKPGAPDIVADKMFIKVKE